MHARKPAIAPGDNHSAAGIASQAPLAHGRAAPNYKTLFEGAGRLIEAGDEAALLAQLCQTLAESGLFISAAVGRFDRQKIWRHHGTANCRDAAGFRAAMITYQPGEPDPPLCLLAWAARKTLVANHYTSDPRFLRYREAAQNLGVGAIAAIVIRRHRQRWAVLSVSAADENFFDADIINLLERLSGIAGRRLDELDCKTALAAERAAQSRATRCNALTALPNAIALAEEFPEILARAQQRAAATAVARLDIENLDGIFLHWGFAAGEAVLLEFSRRLRACLRRPDFLAHCGGEKFAILFGAASGAAAAAFAARLRKTLSAPVTLPSGQSLHVPHILGITLCPRDGSQPAALLEQAETALHAAKTAKAGSENWRLFEPAAPGQNAPGRVLARLAQNALRLHYQPVLELFSGRIISVEALARLEDAGQLRLPEHFCPAC